MGMPGMEVGMWVMIEMREISVGMPAIMVGMRGIRVRMQRIAVGMR